MGWNSRMIRRYLENGIGIKEPIIGIHEVYYKEGKIDMWTQDPVEPYGHDLDEIKRYMKGFVSALDKPILQEVEFKGKNFLVEVEDDPDWWEDMDVSSKTRN